MLNVQCNVILNWEIYKKYNKFCWTLRDIHTIECPYTTRPNSFPLHWGSSSVVSCYKTSRELTVTWASRRGSWGGDRAVPRLWLDHVIHVETPAAAHTCIDTCTHTWLLLPAVAAATTPPPVATARDAAARRTAPWCACTGRTCRHVYTARHVYLQWGHVCPCRDARPRTQQLPSRTTRLGQLEIPATNIFLDFMCEWIFFPILQLTGCSKTVDRGQARDRLFARCHEHRGSLLTPR